MESTAGKLALSGAVYLTLPQKQRYWLVRPMVSQGGLANFYGKPKTGKTQGALGMALAIANGASHWNGFPVETHGPVLLIQLDTPEGEMFDRLKALADGGHSLDNFYIADMDIAPYPFNILTPQHQTWLRYQIETIHPVLVIIDTIREAHEGDENDSTTMKKVINTLVSLIRGALKPVPAVILISHSRKDSAMNSMGADQDIMDEGRGSSYMPGRMDTIVRFTGNPFKTKGFMTYKGRSKGADGRIPLVGDPDTGLLHLEGEKAKEEQLVLRALNDASLPSIHAKAQWLVDQGVGSISTATRRLKEQLSLVPQQPVDAK